MTSEARTRLLEHREKFERAVPWGRALWVTLEAYDFTPSHVRRADDGVWMVQVHPPRAEQDRYGLAPEVLLLVVDGEVLGRHLRAAGDEVIRSGLRLDAKLVIVADRPKAAECTAPLGERLQRIPGNEQRVAWVSDGEAWPDLRVELARQLPTTDIFDDYDPVRGDQLMGRAAELAELTTRVMRGDAVGVFGLRKVGKTSLARGVTDRIDPTSALRLAAKGDVPEGDAMVVWYDLGNLQRRTADGLADALLDRLGARIRAGSGRWSAPSAGGMEGLQRAVEPLFDAGKRICVVLDEYDLLFEDEGGGGPVTHLNRFFRAIRGWSQQWQGQTSLVLLGRDPAHLSEPLLGGVTNPLLAWFKPLWLGPLRPPGDRELLRRLGRRVGLDVGHETADAARAWTGGHPLMLRQFGAAIHELVRGAALVRGARVGTDAMQARAVEPFLSREPVLVVQREIMALLEHRYPEAKELLVALATSGAASPVNVTAPPSDAARTLQRFGLVDAASGQVPRFLAEYIRRLMPRPTRLAS